MEKVRPDIIGNLIQLFLNVLEQSKDVPTPKKKFAKMIKLPDGTCKVVIKTAFTSKTEAEQHKDFNDRLHKAVGSI